MWIGVVTAMPQLIAAGMSDGVVGRAVATDQLDVELFNVRDYAKDRYGSIDDHPFGGSPGMLMMAEPLAACTDDALKKSPVASPENDLPQPTRQDVQPGDRSRASRARGDVVDQCAIRRSR